MKNVNEYLKFIQEGKNSKDPSMPNPYDYQSLELDPNITKSDYDKMSAWLKKMKPLMDPHELELEWGLDPKWLVDGYSWFNTSPRDMARFGWTGKTYRNGNQPDFRFMHKFVILDGNKRVGAVKLNTISLVWISWTPGYNYSLRGTMKMLDHLRDKKVDVIIDPSPAGIDTVIWHLNKPSINVAQKLKMEKGHVYEGNIDYKLKKNMFWWNPIK